MSRYAWAVVVVVGAASGIGEILFSIFLNDGVASAIFTAGVGVAFLVGAWLARARRVAGAVIVGLLCLLEVVFLPAYSWDVSTGRVLLQGGYGVLGLLGLVAGAAIVVQSRRARTG